MESTLLGLVLDSSVLIAAERRKLTPEQAIERYGRRPERSRFESIPASLSDASVRGTALRSVKLWAYLPRPVYFEVVALMKLLCYRCRRHRFILLPCLWG